MDATATNDDSCKRVQWMYNIDGDREYGWWAYGDVENMIIEEAYQANEPHVSLDHCHLDFSRMVELSNEINP